MKIKSRKTNMTSTSDDCHDVIIEAFMVKANLFKHERRCSIYIHACTVGVPTFNTKLLDLAG